MTLRTRREVDGQVVYDNGDDTRPEYDPAIANQRSIEDAARAALANNRTFLANTSPTAAATTAQVKALTRQNNGIIRLLLNELNGTD